MDELQKLRSSLHSPDGGGSKTSTLRNKLEGELKFENRGKSLSHKSPSPAPAGARRRTASSNQVSSDSKEQSPLTFQPANIPVAPIFSLPKSKASKQEKEKEEKKTKQSAVKVI